MVAKTREPRPDDDAPRTPDPESWTRFLDPFQQDWPQDRPRLTGPPGQETRPDPAAPGAGSIPPHRDAA